MASKTFVPAAHFHFLTPLYDLFMRTFFGKAIRDIATHIAMRVRSPHAILDLGCGPGNLIIELNKIFPAARITGLDIDPAILKVAREKFERAGMNVHLVEASATHVPLHETFDVVVSTLMIHHLNPTQRAHMLTEARRLLKPHGRFFLFDFGPPQGGVARVLMPIFGLVEDLGDGAQERYPDMMRAAGFTKITSLYRTGFFELLEAHVYT